tara:strand:+ start:251 stop:424 length:174 start_codon:yes stop_codon:yes gene_type:complete
MTYFNKKYENNDEFDILEIVDFLDMYLSQSVSLEIMDKMAKRILVKLKPIQRRMNDG